MKLLFEHHIRLWTNRSIISQILRSCLFHWWTFENALRKQPYSALQSSMFCIEVSNAALRKLTIMTWHSIWRYAIPWQDVAVFVIFWSRSPHWRSSTDWNALLKILKNTRTNNPRIYFCFRTHLIFRYVNFAFSRGGHVFVQVVCKAGIPAHVQSER